MKLFDSELKVMEVLWREGDTPAKEIARVLTGELGWNLEDEAPSDFAATVANHFAGF